MTTTARSEVHDGPSRGPRRPVARSTMAHRDHDVPSWGPSTHPRFDRFPINKFLKHFLSIFKRKSDGIAIYLEILEENRLLQLSNLEQRRWEENRLLQFMFREIAVLFDSSSALQFSSSSLLQLSNFLTLDEVCFKLQFFNLQLFSSIFNVLSSISIFYSSI